MDNPKNIVRAIVKIKGTKAILWHRFCAEVFAHEKKERVGTAGNDPEEWKKTVLVTNDKQLYIEPSYIFACLRDGAKYTKRGRSTLQPLISATLQVLDDKILVDRFLPDEITTNIENPVYIDMRSVRNPVTRSRNLRYRVGSSPGWNAVFNIAWDKTILSKPEMNSVVIDAGLFSGLGDARNIGYGRFSVEEFYVIEYA